MSGEKFANVAPYSKRQGIEAAHDSVGRYIVRIGSATAGLQIGTSNQYTISSAMTVCQGNNTKTVLAAQGATTLIYIHGWFVFNDSTQSSRFKLRFGSTPVEYFGLPAKGAANWNLINGAHVATNKAIIVQMLNSAGSCVCTVHYKKV